MSRTANFFLGMIVGTASGLAAGVLFAPDSGMNTRDKLNYRLFRTRERLLDLVDGLDSNGPGHSAKAENQRVIKEAKQKAEMLLEDVESLIGQIKNKPLQ